MPDLAAFGRLEYTLAEYETLLRSLLEDGFSFTDFSAPVDAKEVVLRHDVDLSPMKALEMARIEATLGVQSTYCFLVTSPIYNLLEVEHTRAIAEIDALGHDVALHCNTHHYWDEQPSTDTLTAQVRAECDVLATLLGAAVETVSFHRPPEWVLDRDFAGFENTYQPAFFSAITYRSDSRQKWRREVPFPEGHPERLQLLIHPELWGDRPRSMDAIVSAHALERREYVETYLEAL